MRRALVDLAPVTHAGVGERVLDLGYLLRRGAAVVIGEGEVDLGAGQQARIAMGTVLAVGVRAAEA